MPEWRIKHRLEPALNKALNGSLSFMAVGFCALLLAAPFHNRPVGLVGLGIYAFGLFGYLLANLGFLVAFTRLFLQADKVVTSMLDGLWRQERRRLRQLAEGPMNMAAARARWIKVQAQVLDRRVAFAALLGAGILAVSKVLQAYVSPLVEPEWRLFITALPHLAAFSSAIPALVFHSLATKLIRLEHQVAEVAATQQSAGSGETSLSAVARRRMRLRTAAPAV